MRELRYSKVTFITRRTCCANKYIRLNVDPDNDVVRGGVKTSGYESPATFSVEPKKTE